MSNFKVGEDDDQIKLIEELRELKKITKKTFKEISDKTAENGEYVSESTIKNVFSLETKHRHDFDHTLQPIYNALVPSSDNDQPIIHIYKTRLEIQSETIRQLEEKIISLEEEYTKRLDKNDEKHKAQEEVYTNFINTLQDEIKYKNEQINQLLDSVEKKSTAIRELYTILIGLKKSEEVFF